jgi:hypothetical protein
MVHYNMLEPSSGISITPPTTTLPVQVPGLVAVCTCVYAGLALPSSLHLHVGGSRVHLALLGGSGQENWFWVYPVSQSDALVGPPMAHV